MFKLSQSETYFWPVTVETPVSGGKFEKANFDAEFKRLSASEKEEFRKKLVDVKSDIACAKELLIGWKGIADADGSELPYSETNKEKLLEVSNTGTAVVHAFIESISKEKTKN